MKYKSSYSEIYIKRKDAGQNYERVMSNRFESFIFKLEKYFLTKEIVNIQGKEKVFLDFACGTGRIIGFIVNNFKFTEYVGIDSSSSMINVASKKITNNHTRFIVGNIANNNSLLKNDQFDLVTAFRLILNLESDNRLSLLNALYQKIKKGGVLMVNNHMNRYSILGMISLLIRKILRWPPKNDLQAKLKGKRTIINTMSELEMRSLLKNSGFTITRVYRFSLLPGYKNTLLLPEWLLFRLELFLSQIPIINLFGKNQIYICKKI